jgi:hypothetical protein
MGMIYSNHLWWFGYGLSKFFWVYHITKYINILVRRSLRSSKPHACARLPPRFKLQELKIQLSCKTSSRKGQTSFKIHGSCKAENSSRTRFLPKTQKTLNVTMTKWFVRFNAKKSQSIAPATKKRTQGLKLFEVPRSLRSKPQSLVFEGYAIGHPCLHLPRLCVRADNFTPTTFSEMCIVPCTCHAKQRFWSFKRWNLCGTLTQNPRPTTLKPCRKKHLQ